MTSPLTTSVDSPVGGTAGSPAATGEDEIAHARTRIDALDEQIIALVRERMTVSAGIQQARIAGGGPRVHLNREMEILAHYRAELGKPGTAMAMTLLELSRGRV